MKKNEVDPSLYSLFQELAVPARMEPLHVVAHFVHVKEA
jgi:hypothetical protein